jgi:hypothetical protein
VDPAHHEDSCRAYANQFLEAAKTRQAASLCENVDRQRMLDRLDAEIDALNDLIATQCGGS